MLATRIHSVFTLLGIAMAISSPIQPTPSISRRGNPFSSFFKGKVDAHAVSKPKPQRLGPQDRLPTNAGTPAKPPPTRSDHLDPFRNEGDSTGSGVNRELAEAAVDSFFDWIKGQWPGSVTSETPTSTISSMAFDSISYIMAAATASPDPLNYYAVLDQWLPSKDVAVDLAARGDLANYSSLLTPAEYQMYQDDPLCYFANIEEMHWYALFERYETSPSTSEVTDVPMKRDVQARSFSNEDANVLYTKLFTQVLQEHMSTIHMAEPTATTGSPTAMVVQTTSCPGLSGINNGTGVSTSYRMLEVVQTSAPTSGDSGSSPLTSPSTSSSPEVAMSCWAFLLLGITVSFVAH